jgi:hypothetical protein
MEKHWLWRRGNMRKLISVYTQRSSYSCILEALMSLNMNILVVVLVGYFGGNPNWMGTTIFFLWENVAVKTFTFFCGVIFVSISNSVYCESGKMIREKLGVSRDRSQADAVLWFCVRLDDNLKSYDQYYFVSFWYIKHFSFSLYFILSLL